MEKFKMHMEAMSRMNTLQNKFNLNPKILRYLKEGKLYYSYRVPGLALGCIDTIDSEKQYAKAVKDFEERTGNYVYHVIETKIMGSIRAVETKRVAFRYLEKADDEPVMMLTFLYVSPEEEDWVAERLENDYIAAYVMDLNERFCGMYYGEYDDVFLTSDNGALLRKA